ncbi:hypothetical protein OHB49_22840 [Streptomyces sp. NBC_01717]|uniref:hypothetical protein n=1 Tax=Streptomyces sp. NBC_01717 TaxID=2975918 RepID=UPI002E3059CF|nr:hypothetical protein [Streptomyces sp. NBC_01717]
MDDKTTDETAGLLSAYDEQMRGVSPNPPAGVGYEQDGPLIRTVGQFRGFISAPRDVQVRGAALDALIARQRDRFAARAQIAAARGVNYLQVDASSDSAPILRRLGFQAVTTTTPYVWSPPEETVGP